MPTREYTRPRILEPIGTRLAEMTFGAPEPVRQALLSAVTDARFGYLGPSDVARLGEVTAEWLEHEYDWRVDPEQIRPVGDLVAGFRAVLTHFVPENQPIIVPTPSYMPFLSLPETIGRPVIEVPMLRGESGWEYDFAGLREAFEQGGRLLVLCNPHNPIGKVADDAELARIEALVDAYDGLVFADEIHAPIMLGNRSHTVYARRSAVAAAHTITATSASKAFNIPATKCGQLIFTQPAHLETWLRVGRWHEHQTSLLGIIATESAYRAGRPWLDAVLAEMRATVDTALRVLEPSSARIIRPEATYLLWIDLSGTALDAGPRTAEVLRERAGLVVTDGRECGRSGVGCVRFNGALPREQVNEAMMRLTDALDPRAPTADRGTGRTPRMARLRSSE